MIVHDTPALTPRPPVEADQDHDHGSDAEVAAEVRSHHAGMVAELDRLTARMRDATRAEQSAARSELEQWFETVLVPHADEEEATTYRAARELAEGRLLVDAMVREHVLIKRLVALVRGSDDPAAAAYGRAVFEVFTSHQDKENDVVLPLLVESPGVSLTEVLAGAHGHQLGGRPHHHHH